MRQISKVILVLALVKTKKYETAVKNELVLSPQISYHEKAVFADHIFRRYR